LLRRLRPALGAPRATLVAAVRHKNANPPSTGVVPMLQPPPAVIRPARFPEAITGNRTDIRVIPARIPEFLREKLSPREPVYRPARGKDFLKRKAREATMQRPLVELPDGARPFRVERSRMGNFPIYTDIRNGGNKVVTILRKYSGDVRALVVELQQVTGKEVTAFHGRLEVRGRHQTIMADWLGKIGF